jgi:hypothetical protein
LLLEKMNNVKALDDYEIMESIDAALDKFGPSIKYAVYWNLVVQNNSPKEGICSNPSAFVVALQSIFGKSAAELEKAICQEIRSRAGRGSSASHFPELVAQVRAQRMLVRSLV